MIFLWHRILFERKISPFDIRTHAITLSRYVATAFWLFSYEIVTIIIFFIFSKNVQHIGNIIICGYHHQNFGGIILTFVLNLSNNVNKYVDLCPPQNQSKEFIFIIMLRPIKKPDVSYPHSLKSRHGLND